MTQFLIQFFILGPLFFFAVIALSALAVGVSAFSAQMKEEINEIKHERKNENNHS